jgi:DNA-binding Lrp family transcriptional regulator
MYKVSYQEIIAKIVALDLGYGPGYPDYFHCPLSLNIMIDPVMDVRNCTNYEKTYIVDWLKDKKPNSQIREGLGTGLLRQNESLKYSIQSTLKIEKQIKKGKYIMVKTDEGVEFIVPKKYINICELLVGAVETFGYGGGKSIDDALPLKLTAISFDKFMTYLLEMPDLDKIETTHASVNIIENSTKYITHDQDRLKDLVEIAHIAEFIGLDYVHKEYLCREIAKNMSSTKEYKSKLSRIKRDSNYTLISQLHKRDLADYCELFGDPIHRLIHVSTKNDMINKILSDENNYTKILFEKRPTTKYFYDYDRPNYWDRA